MRINRIISRRNELIYEAYAELWGKGQREEIIITGLSERFFLAEKTIYRIILKQSKSLKSNNQD